MEVSYMKTEQEDVQSETLTSIPYTADSEKLKEAADKFDSFRQVLETKGYLLELNESSSNYLMNEFFENLEWKGYEAYAVAETYDRLSDILLPKIQDSGVNVSQTISGAVKPEIIEAVFHFLKTYIGAGHKDAWVFKNVCDAFANVIREINEDRQKLRDLSLELVSIEQGIPVEDIMAQMQNQQN